MISQFYFLVGSCLISPVERMGCSVSNLTGFSAQCRSRRTGKYRWAQRYESGGLAELLDQVAAAQGQIWLRSNCWPDRGMEASVDHYYSRSPVQRSSYRLRLICPHPKHATSGLGLGTGTPTGDKVARKGRVAEIDRQGIVQHTTGSRSLAGNRRRRTAVPRTSRRIARIVQ